MQWELGSSTVRKNGKLRTASIKRLSRNTGAVQPRTVAKAVGASGQYTAAAVVRPAMANKYALLTEVLQEHTAAAGRTRVEVQTKQRLKVPIPLLPGLGGTGKE